MNTWRTLIYNLRQALRWALTELRRWAEETLDWLLDRVRMWCERLLARIAEQHSAAVALGADRHAMHKKAIVRLGETLTEVSAWIIEQAETLTPEEALVEITEALEAPQLTE